MVNLRIHGDRNTQTLLLSRYLAAWSHVVAPEDLEAQTLYISVPPTGLSDAHVTLTIDGEASTTIVLGGYRST